LVTRWYLSGLLLFIFEVTVTLSFDTGLAVFGANIFLLGVLLMVVGFGQPTMSTVDATT
jgi:hypothetical protein